MEDGFSMLQSQLMVTEGGETHSACSLEIRAGVPARFCGLYRHDTASFLGGRKSFLFPLNSLSTESPFNHWEAPISLLKCVSILLQGSPYLYDFLRGTVKIDLDSHFTFPLTGFVEIFFSRSRVWQYGAIAKAECGNAWVNSKQQLKGGHC